MTECGFSEVVAAAIVDFCVKSYLANGERACRQGLYKEQLPLDLDLAPLLSWKQQRVNLGDMPCIAYPVVV